MDGIIREDGSGARISVIFVVHIYFPIFKKKTYLSITRVTSLSHDDILEFTVNSTVFPYKVKYCKFLENVSPIKESCEKVHLEIGLQNIGSKFQA